MTQPYPDPNANPGGPAYPAPVPPAPAWQAPVPPAPVWQAQMAPQAYPPIAAPAPYQQAPAKSPVLGIVGLAIVVICGIAFFVFSLTLFRDVFSIVGVDATGAATITELTDAQANELMTKAAGPFAGMGIVSVVGLAGFIISIVATARNSGRWFGVVGIILGVLAPFVGFFMAAPLALP